MLLASLEKPFCLAFYSKCKTHVFLFPPCKALVVRISRSVPILFLHENICCRYSLEVPHWGTSNEYPQHTFSWRNMKIIFFLAEKKAPYLRAVHENQMWPYKTQSNGRPQCMFSWEEHYSYKYYCLFKALMIDFNPFYSSFHLSQLMFTSFLLISI